ncbi:MAG: chromosome segregation protein SMC, partial [Ignavibacteriaceae bacterium]
TELNMKRSEISAQTEKVYSHQSAVSISEERKNSLGKNIERYSGEISELENQKNQSIELIKNGEEEISGIFDQIESSVKKIGELSSNLNGYKTKLEEKQSVYKSGSEELIEKLKVVSGKENELDNLEKKLDEKKKIINKLNDKILGITNNVAKTVGYIEDLDNERKSVNEKIKLSEETYSQKQEEKENLEKQLNDLKTKELELKSTINNVRDKIIFIQDLVENLEGFSAGSKALVENSGWNKKEAVLLANSGNATSEYRIAVEAALKNNLNNILIESLDDLKSGIEYLKKNEAGKASFYFYRNGRSNQKGLVAGLERWNVKRSKKKLRKVKDVYGFAPEFVQTATKWKPYFDSLLENVVIVENLETALQLSGKFGFFKFVTKEGDYIDSNGIIEAGSVPRVDDSLFGRKQLLDELKNELPSYQNKLSEIEKQIEDIDSRINSIDLKDISERGRMLLNDLANIEKQIAQFEFEKNKFNDEIETTHIQVRELAAESVNIDNERLNVNEELEKLIEDRMSTEKSLSDIENAVIEIDHEYKSAIESHNNEKLLLERLQGDKRNLENRKENAENNINSIKNTIERRKEDINRANDEIKNIEIDIEKKSIELKDLLNIKDSMQVEVGKIEEEHSTLRVKVNQQDNNLNELRNEKESISDEMHSIDIKLNELKLKSENLIEHIKENYSLKLEHKQFADLDTFNFTEQNAEVHMLKDKIKNLGPINLLAYSEYEEEKQRQDFLLKQREDLLESEKDIVKTIEEINNTAQEKFTNTFELIRGHFIEIFRGLFNPGDEADLRLEENVDPLEAKIEIIAKPKGKRPTSIDLLSGGEKTLTAIALLFAIYLVKPSPFCILDEIDAPLDDANIDRFTKILEDFSSDTQFIVVTHNKRTMEAAQTMYGVTMQEEGVSKLVSVLFNEDFDFVAQG